MDSTRILVVEDDVNVCELLRLYLEREGFDVHVCNDGPNGLRLALAQDWDLIVLDVMLPQMDGWEICQALRKSKETPIIMLTARGEDVDKILGLELGADDYLAKPFNPRELVARIRAVLRRAKYGDDPKGDEENRKVIRFLNLEIYVEQREVRLDGQRVQLTPKEFDLLHHMCGNEGRVFSREELLESVWGYDYYGDSRTIDVHVKRLREKVERPGGHKYIQTVWGIGYKFEAIQT